MSCPRLEGALCTATRNGQRDGSTTVNKIYIVHKPARRELEAHILLLIGWIVEYISQLCIPMHSTPEAPHTTSGRLCTAVYGAFAKNKIDQVPATAGNIHLQRRIPYGRLPMGNRHFYPWNTESRNPMASCEYHVPVTYYVHRATYNVIRMRT